VPSAAALAGRNGASLDMDSSWSCICPYPWTGLTCESAQAAILSDGGHQQETEVASRRLRQQATRGISRDGRPQHQVRFADLPPGFHHLAGLRPVASMSFAGRSQKLGKVAAAALPSSSSAGVSSTASATNPPSAASATGVLTNQANGFSELLSTCATTILLLLGCFAFFSIARGRCRPIYEGEAAVGEVPRSLLGWVSQSWNLKIDNIVHETTLDHGMFIEFTRFAGRTLLVVGAPLVLVMCPLYVAFGGNNEANILNQLGASNVKSGSWICWVECAAVWYVVVVVMNSVFYAQAKFLPRRYAWLKRLPEPRANAVLVERLPESCTSDAMVKAYFDQEVFARPVVEKAHVVKDTGELLYHIKRLQRIDEQIERAPRRGGDSYAGLREQKKAVEKEVAKWRQLINKSEEFNTTSAFVRFTKRRDKVMALKMFSEDDEEDIVVSQPPDPADVVWGNLQHDERVSAGREMAGKALIAILFFSFIPLTVFVQGMTRLEGLSPDNMLYFLQRDFPALCVMWNGLAGPLVLSFLMGLVPMVLILIFENFFSLHDKSSTQLLLQEWYYTFLVIFVVLVTAIGHSLFQTILLIIEKPGQIMVILAGTLPQASNFYLTYVVVQLGVDGFAMVRLASVSKYMTLKPILGDARAKELAEPEDQATQGIGSRSARMSLLLVIPLVFCTLSPIITIFGMINFAVCRVVYGYLFMYAESLKGDSGGLYWAAELRCIQLSILIFILLMTGVLYERASTKLCGSIAMGSLIYWKYSYDRFMREHKMESLSFQQLKEFEREHETQGYDPLDDLFPRNHKPLEGGYMQPELLDNPTTPRAKGRQAAHGKDASSSAAGRAQRKVCC